MPIVLAILKFIFYAIISCIALVAGVILAALAGESGSGNALVHYNKRETKNIPEKCQHIEWQGLTGLENVGIEKCKFCGISRAVYCDNNGRVIKRRYL